MFVCVEDLPPIQPYGVMSSMVSLPYHMFTGRAKWLTSIVHILLPKRTTALLDSAEGKE